MDQLVPGVNHQGVLLAVSPITYLDVDELLQRVAPDRDAVREGKPVIVVLDHIQDPHNLGAIVRSCAATGVQGIIIPERGAAPVTAAAVKTSAGTMSQVMVARTGNLLQLIEQLKERGYWVAGADGAGETSLSAMDWDRPLALVIGSEEKGMSRTVSAACDYRVSIPMENSVESLNASMAAALLLFAASCGHKTVPEDYRLQQGNQGRSCRTPFRPALSLMPLSPARAAARPPGARYSLSPRRSPCRRSRSTAAEPR